MSRVVVVDDHQLVRQGLALQLAEFGAVVVGEAVSARDAYTVIESTRPELVLLDLGLPGVDGIAATRELRRRWPALRILILSGYSSPDTVARALHAGAHGFLLKSDPASTLGDALHALASGQRYLAAAIPVDEVETLLRHHQLGTGGALAALSPREREVFDLFVKGASNRDVAATLHISVKTVETHRTHIFEKLGLHSMAELIRLAAQEGLLPATAPPPAREG